MASREIIVSLSLYNTTIKVGRLWQHIRNGRERASFEYDKEWLRHPERFPLEPALTLSKGAFHTRDNLSVFGSIGDSAPDRWGRILMRRIESINAKMEDRLPKTLHEIDYLLGVNDEARQGALRFSAPDHETHYLTSSENFSIPPLIKLPQLLAATERVLEDKENASDLKLLLAPGSSLGGARPKASLLDKDGYLSIAKFSRKDDEFDAVLWEAVALSLAQKAKIKTSTWHLERILNKPVLIIRRFDRNLKIRIPFLSAMSLLDARDNEHHSYLEIAYAITQFGSQPKKDLHELWRRIVFSILISNTDDHLRNHGFLYSPYKGWQLSPLYDVNPTPLEIKPHILTTAINYEETTASLEIALSVLEDFRLSLKEAQQIIKEVHSAVKTWRNVAKKLGISNQECERMKTAFRLEERS